MVLTDRAERAANWAEIGLANRTRYGMSITNSMPTVFVIVTVLATTSLAAEGATLTAGVAIANPTFRAGRSTDRQPGTGGTFDQTDATVGNLSNCRVEARAHHLTTAVTTGQTTLTEPLTTGATDADLGAVLRTAWTTHGAGCADQDAFTRLGAHVVAP